MKFIQVEPNENFPAGRWVSEQQRWEIGFCPVIFGVRVRFGRIGSNCVELNYCAGADATFALILLATVVQILSVIPETVSPQEVQQIFPTYTLTLLGLKARGFFLQPVGLLIDVTTNE